MAAGTGPEPITSEQASLSADPKAPRLRPYQTAAIAAVREQFDRGVSSTLLVLPTGTGKTVCFAELDRGWIAVGDRTLVLAHRTELLEQAAKKHRDVGVRCEIDQGDRRASSSAMVVIASVQTLRGARLLRYPRDWFRKIVVDEAHHAAATGYQQILDHFEGAQVLGVTATPKRLDGKPLGDTFKTVAFMYEMRTAIAEQYLVPLVARRVRVADLDLRSVKVVRGDLDQGELARILTAEKALHAMVSPLVQLAGDRKTLVFCVDVAHAKAVAEVLNRHKPGSALALDGKAKQAERRAAVDLFARGAIQYLVNCELYTEGFDEPSVACVAMLRPTQSWTLFCQMLGRGTRLLGTTYAESVANGKRDCLVLDFVGNSRHRLIGPADALAGGPLADDVAAKADSALEKGQAELTELLQHVEDEVAAKRSEKALIALAVYRTKEIDVFIGEQMPTWDPDSPAGKRPATDAQLDALKRKGMGDPPPGLTVAEASAMLDGLAERERLGLATPAQLRVLRPLKLDLRGMTKRRASELFVKAKTLNAWGKHWLFRNEPEYMRTPEAQRA